MWQHNAIFEDRPVIAGRGASARSAESVRGCGTVAETDGGAMIRTP